MTIKTMLAVLATAALLSTGAAYAQTSSAPPAATDSGAKKQQKPRTAKSIECSKQADAKGLHGKERKKFRSECKKS